MIETLPKNPAVLLSGVVDYDMYTKFRSQFDEASGQDLVVIEMSTLAGDPEVARMMGEDVRFASEMEPKGALSSWARQRSTRRAQAPLTTCIAIVQGNPE